MPRVGFVCPDNTKVKFADCIVDCDNRCVELPILERLAQSYHAKNHKPSVTECLQPTRIAYFQRLCDYYTSPQDLVWILLGIEAHSKLESAATDAMTEQTVGDSDLPGRLDYFRTANGHGRLLDYKTWGAYSVAKNLGIVQTGMRPTGTFFRDSGKPILEKVFERVPAKADCRDVTLQLNCYRMMLEERGHRVDSMAVCAIARDGGTAHARDCGITQNIYTIEVERMENAKVTLYFHAKSKALMDALETNTVPPMCTPEENWKGRRCNKWCNIAEYCREAR